MLQSQTVEDIVSAKSESNPVLLKELAKRGIDNSKPRDIDHTLLAFSEDDEEAAIKELENMGFSVACIEDEDDDEILDDVEEDEFAAVDDEEEDYFVIEATIHQSPMEAASDEFVTKIAELCVKYNLEYDGWGTALD